jgi:hypothetical protein
MRTRPSLALPLLPVLTLLSLLTTGAALGRHATADDVVLAGGTRLTGVVLERGPERVRVLLPEGDELTLATADVREVVPDESAPKGDKVVRYASASKAGGTKAAREGLEVALLHLVHPGTGQRVDLVGAVHIADLAFFREVQRVLEDADVVLYEMVKPQGADPEAEQEGENVLRAFQQKLAGWFGFAFQLDGISYDRPHFVHADMTMEEFSGAAEGLGKVGTGPASEGDPAPAPAPGAPKPGLKLPGALGNIEGQIGMIEALLKGLGIEDLTRGPQVRRSVKMMLGRVLGAMGSKVGVLLGAEASELLITKRNEVVIERLKELMPKDPPSDVPPGRPASARTIAIFYGAAHLPDLEQRLLALGYERVGARWMLAWDMSEAATATTAAR